MVLDAGSVWHHKPIWFDRQRWASPGVRYQNVFFTLLTNPNDTTCFRCVCHSPQPLWRRFRAPLHSPANQWNWWPLRSLFSCKCVQIENIVHQRGSPSLLRRFALAFLLFPWERCFPFKCYLSVSFKTSSFLLTNSLEERPSPAHWASFSAIRQREKKRERCSAGASLRHPWSCLFFPLPSEDELFYSGK